MGWLRGSRVDGGEVVVLVVVNRLCRNWESCHRAIGGSGAGKPHLKLNPQTQHQDAITNYNRHALATTADTLSPTAADTLTFSYAPRSLRRHARSSRRPALAEKTALSTALIASLTNVLPRCGPSISLGPRRGQVSVIRTVLFVRTSATNVFCRCHVPCVPSPSFCRVSLFARV
jgi:hypothetical protein